MAGSSRSRQRGSCCSRTGVGHRLLQLPLLPLLLTLLVVLAAMATTASAFFITPIARASHRRAPGALRMAATLPSSTEPGVVDEEGLRRLLRLSSPPGPRGVPLLGNVAQVVARGGFDKYDAWVFEKYGPLVKSRIMAERWYTVSSPELAQEVLQPREKGDFVDRALMGTMQEVWGNKGMIFANGPEQALNRRLTNPAFFRADILEWTNSIILDLAEQLARNYGREAAEASGGGKGQGKAVDVWQTMQLLTLETVTQACFSLPLGLLDEAAAADSKYDGPRIFRLMRTASTSLSQSTLSLLPPRLNPAFWRLKRSWAELMEVESRIVEDRRAARAAAASATGAGPDARDLLDVYLEAEEGGGERLSVENLLASMFDVFLGGSDTTASTIAATLHEIVTHPPVLARVLAELEGLDLSNPEHRTTAGMAARLPYLDSCIKEALRLYPALPFAIRRASRHMALGGYFVPEGAFVAASITNLHRDPATWGPDALDFRPERWEETTAAGGLLEATLPKGAYIPFGMGPRVCLGARLSILEIRTVVAVLLKRLAWAPAPRPPSRRRRLVGRVRRAVGLGGESGNKEGAGGAERLEIAYPGTAAFPKGVWLRVQEGRKK